VNIIDIYDGANTPFSSVPIRTYYKKYRYHRGFILQISFLDATAQPRDVSSIMYYIKPIQEMPRKTSKKLTELLLIFLRR